MMLVFIFLPPVVFAEYDCSSYGHKIKKLNKKYRAAYGERNFVLLSELKTQKEALKSRQEECNKNAQQAKSTQKAESKKHEKSRTGKVSDYGKSYADSLADMKKIPKKDRDKFYMELARDIAMKPGGRAAEYLDHFLGGSGTPKEFSIEQLLSEDKNVKDRLTNEIVRRVLNIKTLREKGQDQKMSLTEAAQKDREVITIFQKNYDNEDWNNALGTYPFTWDVIGVTDDKKFIKVSIKGQDTYEWHPGDSRQTKFLHEAGDRLKKTGQAKEFEMIARPYTYYISTENKDLLEMITFEQTNPKRTTWENIKRKSGQAGNMVDEARKAAWESARDALLEGLK
jgi:hypothetical protein